MGPEEPTKAIPGIDPAPYADETYISGGPSRVLGGAPGVSGGPLGVQGPPKAPGVLGGPSGGSLMLRGAAFGTPAGLGGGLWKSLGFLGLLGWLVGP